MKLWRHPITIVLLASAVSMTGIALGQETAPNAMVDAAYIRTVSTDNPLGMPSVNTSSEPAKSEAKGIWLSIVEAQVIPDVNRRLTLVLEPNLGWSTRDPGHQLRTVVWNIRDGDHARKSVSGY
jgi:hypothetical protein